MSRAFHETAGYTLVELLVASIVLAILLALAAPPLGRGERRWGAYAAGRTLAAEVARVWPVTPESWRWDNYPYIFLTLMLSLQASYAAPLILLAQNRQEQRDKVVAEQDRQANARAHADIEFLAREVASLRMAVGEVATRDFIRSELKALLADLDEKQVDVARPEDEGAGGRG